MPLHLDPLPAGLPPQVERWATVLRRLADETGAPSVRKLAPEVHCSPASLSRYLKGARVRDSLPVAERLAAVAAARGGKPPADHVLASLWEQAVGATSAAPSTARADSADAPGPGAGTAPGADPARRSGLPHRLPRHARTRRGLAVGGCAVVGLTLAVLVLPGRLSPDPPRYSKTWQVRITGTWSDRYQRHIGVFRFRSPDIPGDTDGEYYDEGEPVSIVCQERHRREVPDPTTGESSPVWDRTADGWWIPDLYTDLPKVAGETPPLDIPPCDG